MSESFKAMVIHKQDGKPVAVIRDVTPDHPVRVRIDWSSLNCTGGLALTRAMRDARTRAWCSNARDLDPALLPSMTRVEPFARLPELAQKIGAGRIRGRVVIDIAA